MIRRQLARLIGMGVMAALIAIAQGSVSGGASAVAPWAGAKGEEPRPQLPREIKPVPPAVGAAIADMNIALEWQQWEIADRATWRVLGLLEDSPEGAQFRQFPCDLLKRVDDSWRHASNGRFGFSVQWRLWATLMNRLGNRAQTEVAFRRAVGWGEGAGDGDASPAGHWPQEQLWRSGNILRFGCGDATCSFPRTTVEESRSALEYIFPRLSQCRLLEHQNSRPLP